MNFLVIDTETGGLDPRTDMLLEIGAKLLSEGGESIFSFHQLIAWDPGIRPRATVKALLINGLLPTGGKHPAEVAETWIQYLYECNKRGPLTILGHNLEFDTSFIESFLNREGYYDWLEAFRDWNRIDTRMIGSFLQRCGLLSSDIKLNLNELHKHFFGVPVPGNHTSLGDCDATWRVYGELRKLALGSKLCPSGL